MADYTNYNSDNISIVKIGNKNYTIVDNPLRSSFKKLSDVIKTNNQTVKDFMNQSNFQHETTAYQLNDSNSFLYAFSNICLDKISNLETNKLDTSTFNDKIGSTHIQGTVTGVLSDLYNKVGNPQTDNTIIHSIGELKAIVGTDGTKGLRKDVADLQGTIGDTSTGMTSVLSKHEKIIDNLIKNKANKSTVDRKITELTSLLDNLTNRVTELENMSYAH